MDEQEHKRESKSKATPGKAPDTEEVINLADVIIILAKVALILGGLFFCLRFPVIWIKLPAMITILSLGLWWLIKPKKLKPEKLKKSPLKALPGDENHYQAGRKAEAAKNYEEAIFHYERAVGNPVRPGYQSVRLLAVYHAAGQYGRAKGLIQRLVGGDFPESVADELESLAANYFPVRMERTRNGSRLTLRDP